MTAPLVRRVLAAVLAASAVFALVGCTPSDDEQKRDIAELTARGFTSPSLASSFILEAPAYSIGVGTCRLTVRRIDNAYWGTWKLTAPADNITSNQINLATLKANATRFGLDACFTETGQK